jgi:sugar phosphate isomerase/epimerase
MMKIGVRAHDFGRMDAGRLAAVIKNAGFDCVQLAPVKAIEGIQSFGDVTAKHLADITEAFTRHGLEITVLGCYIEPSLPDRSRRLGQAEIFKTYLSHAKTLGVGIVGTETTNLPLSAGPSEREERYQLLKDSVLRMIEKAEEADVTVGIEPVAGHTLNTPGLTRRLLDEVGSGKLKVIFDPVNLVLPDTIDKQDLIFDEMFDILGDDIAAVHVKDIVIEGGKKVWRNIGAGVINYRLIIQKLREYKPDIRLLREGVEPDSHQSDRQAMEALIRNT